MSEKNKQLYDFLPMPPPPADELEAAKQPKIFKSKTAKVIGSLLLGASVAAQPLNAMDRIITDIRYPSDSVEIIQAAGAEKIPKGGTEWLMFGGYGQQDVTNAAQELSNALDGEEVVASVKYPNQELSIEELADYVDAYIEERDMSKLNIVGVSMGTIVALMVLNDIKNHAETPFEQYQNVVYHNKQPTTFEQPPEIGVLVAYSSPADVHDAYQGSTGESLVSFASNFDYKPGIFAKAVLSSFDGVGDTYRSLNILKPEQWLSQIIDNIKQTFNDTPPEMAWSQMKIIVAFKDVVEWQKFQNLFSENSYFVYISPNGDDPTVDTQGAYQKFKIMLQHLDVPSTFIRTNEPGHANTGASASALTMVIAASATGQPPSITSIHP